jgi:hypothetical protein
MKKSKKTQKYMTAGKMGKGLDPSYYGKLYMNVGLHEMILNMPSKKKKNTHI